MNWRREKKMDTIGQFGSHAAAAMYEAWHLGQEAASRYLMGKKVKRNPYPKGRRHDEWNRGCKLVMEESHFN